MNHAFLRSYRIESLVELLGYKRGEMDQPAAPVNAT